MIPAFKTLKEKLERLQGNPLETRSFMYLDIIAWLEAKSECAGAAGKERKVFERKKKTLEY